MRFMPIMNYMGMTSRYNEFGRIVIRSPYGDLNKFLVSMLVVSDVPTGIVAMLAHLIDVTKSMYFEALKSVNKNILLIRKNKNGHYKFEVICENQTIDRIIVLVDSDPTDETFSSIGILTPMRKNYDFKLENFNSAAFKTNFLYDKPALKQLIKKFGIEYDDESLTTIANKNKYDKDIEKIQHGGYSNLKRRFRGAKRMVKQHALGMSASMSKTLKPKESTMGMAVDMSEPQQNPQ